MVVEQTKPHFPGTRELEREHGGRPARTGRQGQRRHAERVLKALIRAFDGGPPGALHITRDETGRPRAKGTSAPIDLSVAHSGRWLACGVATEGLLGIDLETTRPRPNAPAVAAAYFGPAEQRMIAETGDQAFLALWTLREAFGKATGQGIAGALSLADIQVVPAVDSAHRFNAAGCEWTIAHRCLGPLHVAIAWSIPDSDQLSRILAEIALQVRSAAAPSATAAS